ncbi:tetratricopeptide repeat protein [Galenea microaerophila]
MKSQKGRSFNRWIKGLGISATIGLGITLSGCTQMPAFLEASNTDLVEAEKESPSALDAQTVYQILVGEMLVQKGQPAAAFDVLYPLAKKLKDPELAKYVFQLSMYTYQVPKIEAATQLWLSFDPKDPMPWKAAYLMSIRQEKMTQALHQWQKWQALTEGPWYQKVLDSAQRIAQSTPPKAGYKFIKRLAAHYPDQWAAQLALGWFAVNQGEYKTAWQVLNQAWRLAQKLPSGEEKNLAQRKTAQVLLELALKAPQYGTQVLDGLLADYISQPTEDFTLLQEVARLQVQMNRFEQAQHTFKRILKQDPDHPMALFGLGVLAFQMGDLKRAEQHFHHLKKQSQLRAVADYYLGRIAQVRKQWTQAAQYFKQVDQSPFQLDAQIQLVLLQVAQTPNKKAYAAAQQKLDQLRLKESVKKDKKSLAKVWVAKAALYAEVGDKKRAINAYRKAIALSPEIEWQFALAALLYETKQYADYEKVLKQILAQSPDNPDALNALGFYYVEQGKNLEEAGKLLQRAMQIAPNRYYIMDSVGWWYFMKGDYPKAEYWLEKALSQQMDDEVLIHLIETKWYAGKHQEAIELWQKHHAQFPKNGKLQKLIEQLQQGQD